MHPFRLAAPVERGLLDSQEGDKTYRDDVAAIPLGMRTATGSGTDVMIFVPANKEQFVSNLLTRDEVYKTFVDQTYIHGRGTSETEAMQAKLFAAEAKHLERMKRLDESDTATLLKLTLVATPLWFYSTWCALTEASFEVDLAQPKFLNHSFVASWHVFNYSDEALLASYTRLILNPLIMNRKGMEGEDEVYVFLHVLNKDKTSYQYFKMLYRNSRVLAQWDPLSNRIRDELTTWPWCTLEIKLAMDGCKGQLSDFVSTEEASVPFVKLLSDYGLVNSVSSPGLYTKLYLCRQAHSEILSLAAFVRKTPDTFPSRQCVGTKLSLKIAITLCHAWRLPDGKIMSQIFLFPTDELVFAINASSTLFSPNPKSRMVDLTGCDYDRFGSDAVYVLVTNGSWVLVVDENRFELTLDLYPILFWFCLVFARTGGRSGVISLSSTPKQLREVDISGIIQHQDLSRYDLEFKELELWFQGKRNDDVSLAVTKMTHPELIDYNWENEL